MVPSERSNPTVRWARWLTSAGYVASFVARILPHVWNVTPLGATATFGAARAGLGRALAGLLLTMAASDAVLWVTQYRAAGFPPVTAVTPFVYVGLVGYVVLGRLLGRRASLLGPASALVAGSTWFFVVSNFGVWLAGYYPRTVAGLVACYAAALPFWRNMLMGDLFFGLILFQGYAWLTRSAVARAPEQAAPLNNS